MGYSKGYVVSWHHMFVLLTGFAIIIAGLSSCGAEAKSSAKLVRTEQVDVILPPCTEVEAPIPYPEANANCFQVEGQEILEEL